MSFFDAYRMDASCVTNPQVNTDWFAALDQIMDELDEMYDLIRKDLIRKILVVQKSLVKMQDRLYNSLMQRIVPVMGSLQGMYNDLEIQGMIQADQARQLVPAIGQPRFQLEDDRNVLEFQGTTENRSNANENVTQQTNQTVISQNQEPQAEEMKPNVQTTNTGIERVVNQSDNQPVSSNDNQRTDIKPQTQTQTTNLVDTRVHTSNGKTVHPNGNVIFDCDKGKLEIIVRVDQDARNETQGKGKEQEGDIIGAGVSEAFTAFDWSQRVSVQIQEDVIIGESNTQRRGLD